MDGSNEKARASKWDGQVRPLKCPSRAVRISNTKAGAADPWKQHSLRQYRSSHSKRVGAYRRSSKKVSCCPVSRKRPSLAEILQPITTEA